MNPTPGDVFAVFDERLRAHVAVQVTHVDGAGGDARAAVVLLDWVGAEPPAVERIGGLRPQVFDFFFRDGDVEHLWVPARVPNRFVHIGTVTPVLTGELHVHGGWPDGRAIWAQRRWDTVPQDVRDRFKAALRDDDRTVVAELNGRVLTRALRRFTADQLAADLDHDAFPLVTAVSTDRPVPGLFDFLRRRHLIYEASLRGHGERVVDLRGTHLDRLVLDVTGVEELHLGEGLENLGLFGTFTPGLRVHAEDDGRWLSLTVSGELPTSWSGLGAVESLLVREFHELDIHVLAARFPALTSLTLTGAPGYLRNLADLAALRLEDLDLTDVFGYGPDDLPDLPALETLSLTSIPADVAASVKARARPGLDLSVRQPRKPEWLAQNVDNPFRRWDGAGHITAAQAKKAAALYRQARAAALKSPTVADLTATATAYVEGFNKLSHFIDTEAREQIMDALGDILDTAGTAERDAILAAADRVRDF